jgi:kinesin family protein 16B
LLLTKKSDEELERIQLKKQSLTLDLKNTTTSDVQTDTKGLSSSNEARTTETETCDTFHTANSDCSFASALPSPFPPRQEHQTPDNICELPTSEDDGKTVMSDSGVCLENNNNSSTSNKVSAAIEPQTSSSHHQHPLAKHIFEGDDNLSTNSSQNNNNFYERILRAQMDKLREEIAIKKAEIMRILETGGGKALLDAMINELQELQKEFVKIEMRIEGSRGEFLFSKNNQFISYRSNHRWLSFRW